MSRTRWQTLLLSALLSGVVAFFVLANLQVRGSAGVPVPYLSAAIPVVLAIGLLLLGRGVRRLVARQETAMTPIGAARVVALAKASALVGSVLVGYFGAQLLLALDNLAAPLPQQQALASGLALLAALGLITAAMVVEHWCHVPSDDEDEDGPRGSANSPGPAPA